MIIQIDTEKFSTLGGIVPCVVLAIHENAPAMTAREIAQVIGRDYTRTTTIIRGLKSAGVWSNSLQNANIYLQNAKNGDESLQNANIENEKVCKMQRSLQNAKKETKQEKESFPPLNPLYKEKEKNKEKGLTPCENIAREVEAVEVEPLPASGQALTPWAGGARALDATQSAQVAQMHAEQHPALVEQFCKNNGISKVVFCMLVQEVANEWELAGVTHLNASDARRHLINAVRIKAKALKGTSRTQYETPQEMAQRLESDCKRVREMRKEADAITAGSFVDDLVEQ